MDPEGIERRLAAILSADAVGYSRLMAGDEQGTIATITAYRSEIGKLVAEHRGRVVDTPGDNLLAEFPSALGAVQCAVDIQKVIGGRNKELSEDRRMEFRIGVHLGDISVHDGKLYGDGVNIAARLERLADSAGICVSAAVQEQVRHKLELGFEDLGDQPVKNMPAPVRVYRMLLDTTKRKTRRTRALGWRRFKVGLASTAAVIGLAASGLWLSWPAPLAWVLDLYGLGGLPTNPALPGKPSLVVLPFDNLSSDPEQQYFVAGLTEDLTARLASIPGLFVISRNTAETVVERHGTVEEIGRALGVRYVLEGSVRRENDRVRIVGQLIEAATDSHLWSEQYDGDLVDVFAFQAEIAEQILRALSVRIREAELRRIRRVSTDDLTAYEAYVKGLSLVRRFSRTDNEAARRMFERAIELDAGFADAYAGLANTFSMPQIALWRTDPTELDRAEALARQAISIDPLAPFCHATLAALLIYRGQVSEARGSAETAAQLAPGDDTAQLVLAAVQLRSGSILAGLRGLAEAIRLDPNPPPPMLNVLAELNYRPGRVAKAVELWERARATTPDWIPARLQLAYHYETTGQHPRARQMVDEILRTNPELTVSDTQYFARALLPDDQTPYFEALRQAGMPDEPTGKF